MTARPFFSPPLRAASSFKPKEPHVEFGKHWRELVLPIGAVRVLVNNGVLSSIKNVVDDDCARLEMLGQFTTGARSSFFQLVQGEYLTKIDVRMGADYVHAIRFHTNKRVSPWAGKAAGLVREITAPGGFVIHSLVGSWGHGVREVGAVFHPLAVVEATCLDAIERPLLVELEQGTGDYRAAFTVSAVDVGAIVVNADPDVKWIRVLSRRELAALTMLQDAVYPGGGEHWLQLMEHEVLTCVEVVHDTAVIKGIRWTTTLRTLPWIGQHPTGSLTRVVLACELSDRVCGFYGARGHAGVVALGVLVNAMVGKQSVTATGDTGKRAADGHTASPTVELEQWDVVQDDEG